MEKVQARGLLKVYREFVGRNKQHFLGLAERSNNTGWHRYARRMKERESTGEELVND